MDQNDSLRRFIFESAGIRGEWVRLEQSWQAARQYQKGNATMLQPLGEAFAAVTLLSATLKFKGALILQIQGNGALKTLVAQSTHDRTIRGLVRGDVDPVPGTLPELFGEGYMVLTIETEHAEPYQGIVPLLGNTLAEALQTYFEQSEQLPTRLWLFANETHAAGLLLQALPGQVNEQEDWTRIEMLANTVTEQELLTLSCEEMLYRLFHEENVTLFEPQTVDFACSCSTQKIEKTLYALGREELESIIAELGQIDVQCEFCGRESHYDSVDVERILLAGAALNAAAKTRH